MEQDYLIISNIIEQSEIRVEKEVGFDKKSELSEINQYFYQNKYTIFMIKHKYILSQEDSRNLNALLEIDVNCHKN